MEIAHEASASTLAALLLCCAAGTAAPAFAQNPDEQRIAWSTRIEVASGRGVRGPWRQNESNYHYVDDPSVALDRASDALIVWVDQHRKDVLFQAYDAAGKPRLPAAVNVSRSPATFSWLPRVAVSNVNPRDVFVLWQEIVFSGGSHGGEIFFARSTDGGASFSTPINLSNSVAGDGKGRINRDIWHNGSLDLALGPDGAVYAAWTEYEGPLWFSRSGDGGVSFSKPGRVAGGGSANPARGPALAVADDNTVYLAWTVGENESADIHVARSRDGGRSFGEAVPVAVTKGYSDAPKIAVDRAATLHVVYAESAAGPFGRYDVHYARSRDGARTFEAPRALSREAPAAAQGAAFPALALDASGNVHVTWEVYPDRNGPRGLAYAFSKNGGASFSSAVPVPGTGAASDGINGSLQGMLMRKLAVSAAGDIAIVNSSFKEGSHSRVRLVRGHPEKVRVPRDSPGLP
jgi:hypothetical protein